MIRYTDHINKANLKEVSHYVPRTLVYREPNRVHATRVPARHDRRVTRRDPALDGAGRVNEKAFVERTFMALLTLQHAATREVSLVCDASVLDRILVHDPVARCAVLEQITDHGIDVVGGQLWTCGDVNESLCYSGANLVPLAGGVADLQRFADRALREPRRYAWLIGRAELVMPMWRRLAPCWGPARYIRADQPLLAIGRMPDCANDPCVRQVRRDELDAYSAATAAEIIVEFGIDPRSGERAKNFYRRLAGLIEAGRAWARFERGEVVFKAELGTRSASVGLLQGAWVHPDWRGRGLAAPGTATVVAAIVATGRTACGYVNHSNVAARAAYARVGFAQIGSIASIMLDPPPR